MIVTRTTTIRGYEVDASRTTPLPVLFSFLEQLRWEWMAQPEWGLEDGLHNGHFFVVRRQQMELVERPRYRDALTIDGVIEQIGRSRIVVQHRLSIGDRVVGHARVTGVWLGPNRRLARLPDAARERGRRQSALARPFGTLASAPRVLDTANPSFLDAPRVVFAPVGLTLDVVPFTPEGSVELVVRDSDCDVFAHVNASRWLDYCQDVRRHLARSGVDGLDGLSNRALIDYAGEALAGERLTVDWARDDGMVRFRIHRDGTPLVDAVLGLPASP
jgi:acyl-CoA thioesterase FadM